MLQLRTGNRMAALTVVLAGVLTACGTHTASAPPPSPAATTTSADPEASAKAAVLQVYRDMWDAEDRAYATGQMNADVQKYATDKALTDIKLTVIYYQDYGSVMKGEPVLSPRVTTIQTKTDPYTATITDCVDSSHYIEVNAKTGKPVPVTGGSHRHVVTSTARTVGGVWMILSSVIDRKRTC